MTSKDTAMARSFTVSLDEEKLQKLFNSIDFENCGKYTFLLSAFYSSFLIPHYDYHKIHTIIPSSSHSGSINYAEFVGACLACKEGLRREYAELIFSL